MRVSAPWIRKVILDDADDGNYVIANMNSVVLGGTHQHDDWDRVKIIWFVFIALINAIHKFAIFHLNYKIDCFQFYIGVRPGMPRVGQGIFCNIAKQQGWQKTNQAGIDEKKTIQRAHSQLGREEIRNDETALQIYFTN